MKKLIFIYLTLISLNGIGQNLTPIVQPLIMPKLIVSPDKQDSFIITYSSIRHDSIYFRANKPFSIKGFKSNGGTYFAGYGLTLSANIFAADTNKLATQWDLTKKADTLWIINKLNGGNPITITLSNNTTANSFFGDTTKEYFGSYTITRDTFTRYGKIFIRVVNHKLHVDLGDFTQYSDLGVKLNGFYLSGSNIYLNYTTTNTGKTAKFIYRPMGGVSSFSMVYPSVGIPNSLGTSWGISYDNTNTIPSNYIPILNQSTTGTAGGLTSQYVDWSLSSGGASIKNKPTIPAAQVQTDWNAVSGLGVLLNKPTIPTNNNQLTNGSNYITASALPSFSNNFLHWNGATYTLYSAYNLNSIYLGTIDPTSTTRANIDYQLNVTQLIGGNISSANSGVVGRSYSNYGGYFATVTHDALIGSATNGIGTSGVSSSNFGIYGSSTTNTGGVFDSQSGNLAEFRVSGTTKSTIVPSGIFVLNGIYGFPTGAGTTGQYLTSAGTGNNFTWTTPPNIRSYISASGNYINYSSSTGVISTTWPSYYAIDPTWDCSVGLNGYITLSSNLTLNITNVVNGMEGDLIVTVSSGSPTITLPAGSKLNGTVASLNNGYYHLCWKYDGSTFWFNIAQYQ